MGSRFAILCPGQGGQHAGMFDLLRADEQGAAALHQCGLDQLLEGAVTLDAVLHDEQLLFSNRYAQPLIVAAGMAAWAALREQLPAPALVAGYSVGELTAYGVAGMYAPHAAVALAQARAQCMDACLRQAPQQGLMAVSGLPVAQVATLLAQHDAYVAIETGFDTLIAGGRNDALQTAQAQLTAAGARITPLPVGIASHTPLMAAAVAPLAHALDQIAWQPPQLPVLAACSGLAVHDAAAARAALLQQLTETIRWSACMDACAEHGIELVLELGPGSALSRMLRERHAQIECRSLADFRTLAGALNWLRNRLG